MLFGPLLEVCEKKNITERRNKESIAVVYISWFEGSLSTDFRLTGHLLDPAEGS